MSSSSLPTAKKDPACGKGGAVAPGKSETAGQRRGHKAHGRCGVRRLLRRFGVGKGEKGDMMGKEGEDKQERGREKEKEKEMERA